MFSEKDILIAKEIARSIVFPNDFGPDSCDAYYDYNSLINQLEPFEEEYGYLEVRNGISKLVLVFEKLPFVIKFPFNGMWEYKEVYNEETEEWEENEDSYFRAFHGADSAYGDDYCEAEMKVIELVNHFGFGALMAEEVYIGEINYHSVYIQEKVKSAYSSDIKPTNDSLTRAKNMSIEYKICSDSWRAVVIDLFGEKYWEDFINWALVRCREITSDMHGGNYGYRYDGTPVMFDVSGFDED